MSEVDQIKVKNNGELEQIAMHNANYKRLYNFTPHAYFTLAKDGSILELNLNGYKMLGLEDESSEKNNFIRYVTHDTQATFTEFFNKIFEAEEKQTCKINIVNQKSPEIFTQLEGISFDDNSKCIILAIDITDYEMLKMKATRYQNIFESLNNAILSFNADNGKITDVNQALSNIIGFDSEEIMGKDIWEIPFFNEILMSKEDLNELDNKLKNHYTIRKDNKILELELIHNAYQFGTSKEIQLNFKDVSERINYLQALQESKKALETLNEAKDKFFAIISHDLRSPFNSILGFAELLLQKIDKQDYAKVKQYGAVIQKSSWNAIGLLSNLIEWSRSQNGKLDFKPEYFSLETLLNDILNYSSSAAEQKSITLENEIPVISILADKAMINTILRNLVANAIKFTNPGGKVKTSAVLENKEVKISVSDTGVGIDPQVLEKLFAEAGSHHTIGTNHEEGSGIGLVLCKEFVQKHNGKIWVESKVNEGSTFHFTIPVEPGKC